MTTRSTRAIVLKKALREAKPLYDDAVLESRPIPALKPGQVLLKMGAVALNHRDVWIRRGMYPNIGVGTVFGADGAGTIVASGDGPDDNLLQKRVFMTPIRGWKNHPDGPEDKFGVIGGVKFPPIGTFAEYVIVEREEVVQTPEHLDDVHMAAWPVGGLTAWRAAMIHARVDKGHNVLITGIGGGVALIAMQLCLAKGANVFVTSGSRDKVDKAIKAGASGGVSYKKDDWPAELGKILAGKQLDSVIDAGGGDIMGQTRRILRTGGRVVCYGMADTGAIPFKMIDVMAGKQLIGTMMGSLQDLHDATEFLAQHKIVPIVSHVFKGLESSEDAFEVMRRGDQFGKIVIDVSKTEAKM
ncbi:hypothetical protein C8J56DRAFT_867089 [Mycena floridula]|nr:hypothetical protein C8J56DRAFT_867089 [Mycena floridula]